MNKPLLATAIVAAGLAGIAATCVVAVWHGPNSAVRLEKRIEAAAQTALGDINLLDWTVIADGRWIDLEGAASDETALQAAANAVWSVPGVAKVTASRVQMLPVVPAFAWTAKKEDNRVVIEGVAPTRAAFSAIETRAKALYGSQISSSMKLAAGAPEGVDWEAAAIAGLEAMERLEEGSAILFGRTLTVSGSAATEADADAVRASLNRAIGGVTAIADVAGPPEWTASRKEGRIVLKGKAPSGWMQQALRWAAGGPDKVTDETIVAQTGDWQDRALIALKHLSKFEEGEIAVQGQHFRIRGKAPADVLADLRNDMRGLPDAFAVDYDVSESQPRLAELGDIDLSGDGPERTNACATAIGRLAAANRIEFASNRSDITRRVAAALDKIVAVARQCPDLNLEIQGHTDSVGARSANLTLSRARAEAIRNYLVKRGLSGDRLTAVGFGPDRPAATNATAAGRARNRRIEFRIIRGE